MTLAASTRKIIEELKDCFASARFDENLVTEGFTEHLELLKQPARPVVFHPNPGRAILKVYELSKRDAARDAARAAAWDAAWDAAWAAVRTAAWDAARDAAWTAAWAAAWAAAWDAVRTAAWDAARAAAWDAARAAAWDAARAAAWDANPFYPFLKIIRGGGMFYWVTPEAIHVSQILAFGRDSRLHRENGPAVEYRDSTGLWFWNGVQVTEQTILRPQTFDSKEILKEQNSEVRRVMIERFGMNRFITEAGAKVIHKHDMGALYSIELPGDPDRVLRAVRVKDPSTDREYFLRVPPKIKRADDAVAWTFGFELDCKKEYRPQIET
jgi:hypothetical protein